MRRAWGKELAELETEELITVLEIGMNVLRKRPFSADIRLIELARDLLTIFIQGDAYDKM